MAAVKIMALPPAEEELVIRMRLLTGAAVSKTNLDPPFKLLLKRIIALCDEAEKSPETLERNYTAVLRDIAVLEMQSKKGQAILQANAKEQQSYVVKQQELVEQIKQAEQDIASKKAELEQAKIVRQQNEEYELLRMMLVPLPRRAATQAAINQKQTAIAQIKVEGQRTDATMQRRRQQFALLFHIIEELQRNMEEPMEEGGLGEGECNNTHMEVD